MKLFLKRSLLLSAILAITPMCAMQDASTQTGPKEASLARQPEEIRTQRNAVIAHGIVPALAGTTLFYYKDAIKDLYTGFKDAHAAEIRNLCKNFKGIYAELYATLNANLNPKVKFTIKGYSFPSLAIALTSVMITGAAVYGIARFIDKTQEARNTRAAQQ